MKYFKNKIINDIKNQVGDDKVLCGLSGGVDSTVTALLVSAAVGKNLVCVFVDTGLMREGERNQIESLFKKHFKIRLKVINASKLFYNKLKYVSNPEKKEK